jgi:hypothetical protein
MRLILLLGHGGGTGAREAARDAGKCPAVNELVRALPTRRPTLGPWSGLQACSSRPVDSNTGTSCADRGDQNGMEIRGDLADAGQVAEESQPAGAVPQTSLLPSG